MVVILHGAFEDAEDMTNISGFGELAEKYGFITLYPSGWGLAQDLNLSWAETQSWELLSVRHWNAGHCCGKARQIKVDDAGFVMKSIDLTIKRLKVDTSRIYLVGYSNGGMLAHLVAAKYTNRFAAAAVIAGAINSKLWEKTSLFGSYVLQPTSFTPPKPQGPLPIMIMHATGDATVPYFGRHPTQNTSIIQYGMEGYQYYPVFDSVEKWRQNNKSNPDPINGTLVTGAVRRQLYEGECPVDFVTIDGWKHSWPGRFFTKRLRKDDPLYQFDAGEIIWRFLSKFKRKTVQGKTGPSAQ